MLITRTGRWSLTVPWLLAVLVSGCLRKAPEVTAQPAPEVTAQPAPEAATPEEPPHREVPSGPERPDQASPRRTEEPWMSLAEWRRRHEKQLQAPHRARARLVVIGDSITEGWYDSAAFRKQFAEHEPLNLGVGGDHTQHVLWRIEQGALDGLSPRAAILLIGVNNLGDDFSPEETVLGIRAVLDAVRQKLHDTPVLLLSVLPAGETRADGLRKKIDATNLQLASLELPANVRAADVGAVFLEADGSISKSQMGDFLHPTASGYARLSGAVRPLVDELLASSK